MRKLPKLKTAKETGLENIDKAAAKDFLQEVFAAGQDITASIDPQLIKDFMELDTIEKQKEFCKKTGNSLYIMQSFKFANSEATRPRCQEDYERTGNPVFLMEAYRMHRERQLPIPEWIFEYFDQVAAGFIREGERRLAGGTDEGARPGVYLQEIMEMPRDGFNKYAEYRGRRTRAETMFIMMRKADPMRTKEDICMEIANRLNEKLQAGEKEIQNKTVEGWFEPM